MNLTQSISKHKENDLFKSGTLSIKSQKQMMFPDYHQVNFFFCFIILQISRVFLSGWDNFVILQVISVQIHTVTKINPLSKNSMTCEKLIKI